MSLEVIQSLDNCSGGNQYRLAKDSRVNFSGCYEDDMLAFFQSPLQISLLPGFIVEGLLEKQKKPVV
jgi:hypothetical protein